MDREFTQEQAKALHEFWFHVCKRIARDANIQYYCGFMTETLRLAVEAYGALRPDKNKAEFSVSLVSSHVADDADIVRAKKLIEELEEDRR